MLTTLPGELRQAFRSLARDRSFALGTVATLGLALAATTVIWSLADAVVLRRLPFPAAERLVSIGNDWRGSFTYEHANQSIAEMTDVASLDEVFAAVAAYQTVNYNFTAGEGGPERLRGVEATPGFFATLGVPAQLGKVFADEHDDRVAVLSYGLWQRRFGGDTEIIGRTVRLGAASHEVIGVMPARFSFPDTAVGLWAPVDRTQPWAERRGWRSFRTIARLYPGVSPELAAQEIEHLESRWLREHPESYADPRFGWGMSLWSLHRWVVGDARSTLLLLLAAVGFVTLIACTNVANLFLTRAAGRRRELFVRAALGAGRAALFRQLACEGIVLSMGAGLVGWLAAYAGLESVLLLAPRDLPRLAEVRLDVRVFLFVLLLSLATGLGIAVATYLGVRRTAAASVLSRRDGGVLPQRARQALVIAQTALALVLLASATLVLRSLERLQSVNPGFRSERVTVARIALDAARYPDDPARARFFAALLQRLRARPEVESAGAVSLLPLKDGITDRAVSVTGSSVAPADEWQYEQVRHASEGYFDTAGIPLLSGRDFSGTEAAASLEAIVSAAFAARYWPDRNPLGQAIRIEGGEPPVPVVGVVGDVKHERLEEAALPTFYLPLRRDPPAMTVAVRASGAQDLIPLLRRELAVLDAQQALDDPRPLDQVVAAASGATRFQVRVLGSFALVALVLAAVGTYGVVAYLVEQGRRDFGIRLALGARRSEVTAQVLRRAALHAATGLGFGLALSLATAGVLRRFLYEVSPADPLALGVAASALLAVVLLAAWLPARRAGRVDPIVSLRAE